ncbi:HIT domain-containing protein [Pseudoalteromonas sp. G4]|uniref:HIT domain-containing protein n=1 Tax=Pseudoalteromonas sp. G4 TaxID=2992761 RepID=UPI00237E5261|nr:HIT family protein [Pseudoalteromonas sp. G4]MDE3271635.1 HIT family protein [Pseudoalteromonas sp. G4]
MFELAKELQRDCIEIADWSLCKVLLMNDSQYPWFILVPKVEGARDIIDLNDEEQNELQHESRQLQHLIRDVFSPYKLNVAALGNVVEQLHIHHIARYQNDVAWPKPVWGTFPAKPYRNEQLLKLIEQFNLTE